MVKVLAKRPLLHEVGQGTVAGGDEPRVHGDLARAAQPADGAVLDGGQHLGLRGRGEQADVVEKQRPAVGRLEQTDAGVLGVGERAAFVPEELGLGERLGQRRAVDRDERPGGARALPVQPAGEDALAGAGFALDEHRRQAALEAAFGRDDRLQLRAHGVEAPAEKDPVGLAGRLRGAVLLASRGGLGAAAAEKRQRQLLGLERLGEIIARAEPHRLHGPLHAAERGHHDDAGVFGENALAQQLQRLAVGQVQVHQRELEPQLAQQAAGLRQARRLGHLGAEAAQIRGEALAQDRVVLEHENPAAGGKRGFRSHRPS